MRRGLPRTQTQTLLLLKNENCFYLQETCMYKKCWLFTEKKNKKMNVYLQKRSRLFTCIYKIFTVPRPPLPTLAFSECDSSTGQSPASKNPSVPSGTWSAGDRPVL